MKEREPAVQMKNDFVYFKLKFFFISFSFHLCSRQMRGVLSSSLSHLTFRRENAKMLSFFKRWHFRLKLWKVEKSIWKNRWKKYVARIPLWDFLPHGQTSVKNIIGLKIIKNSGKRWMCCYSMMVMTSKI